MNLLFPTYFNVVELEEDDAEIGLVTLNQAYIVDTT